MTALHPNALQPCPSEGCRKWHLAHSIDHICGESRPSPRRTQRQFRQPGEVVVVHAPWRGHGGAA